MGSVFLKILEFIKLVVDINIFVNDGFWYLVIRVIYVDVDILIGVGFFKGIWFFILFSNRFLWWFLCIVNISFFVEG